MSDQPSFSGVLLSAVKAFDYAGIDTPQMDARLLLSYAAGISHTQLIASMKDPVADDIQERFSQFVSRRLAHEPVHRIIGSREFFGREFTLSAEALIPRPDTETLIEVVLDQIRDKTEVLRILDLGTGSGVIAVTLACELPKANIFAVDVAKDALNDCAQNAKQLGVSDRVQPLYSNMFQNVDGSFDMIVSNPPYIPSGDLANLSPEVRLHDPINALDGGDDGLDFYRTIFASASEFLNPDGTLAFEFGINQAEALCSLAQKHGFTKTMIHKDLSGLCRVLVTSR